MKYQFNNNFYEFKSTLSQESTCETYSDLVLLLQDAIIEKEGVYFFKSLNPSFFNSPSFHDKSGNEWQINKIFINQYILPPCSPEEAFLVGYDFAQKLGKKIARECGGGFRVIFTFDYKTCKVSFHKKRKDELLTLDHDLDGYELEALMLIDT